MTISPLKIVAIVLFIGSAVLAYMSGQHLDPLLWAVWSFAVLSVFAGVIP